MAQSIARPNDDVTVSEDTLRPLAQSHPLPLDKVGAYLAAHGFAVDQDRPARQFAGGLANINYLIYVSGKPVVLRRPPAGELPKGAYDMGRENRVLSRLWRALPFVPRGLHLCDDLSVLGVQFQLIEFREGIVIRGADFPYSAERAGAVSRALVETLAQLHGVDPASVDLEKLGRPEGFFERGVSGWRGRGLQVTDEPGHVRAITELADWLSAQSVNSKDVSLLHSDFKLDNCILDPDTLAPNAVVDWDMGTLGHPLMDLATLLSYWTEPGDPPCMHRLEQMPSASPGFLTRADIVEAYSKATGRDVSDYFAFRVLAMLKLGVVFLQLHQRWASGAIGDERYAGFRTLGGELLDYAHTVMRERLA